MKRKNLIEFKVYGRYALFTDPLTRIGGEKFTYQVPTYQALKGITESVYWKPTLQWFIDDVRIINRIQTQSQGIRPIKYTGGNDLSIYTYLKDVEYQVRAHFEWNENRKDLERDRNENKHYIVAKRMLSRGGRRDIFLGTRECQGYVEPCKFGEGEGYYDDTDMDFSLMFHGMTYPDEAYNDETKDKMTARFWMPKMVNGYIQFIRPEECSIHRRLREMNMKTFDDSNFTVIGEFEEGGVFDGVD
ncbi:MAG TPA: type I-C CRISPR-associated protein Cas5 [Clostridiales bacterium]|jgi:CRISPR-associated protein Cas5d|nr:type I-C CRISPR-associated protein Cas5 [Clostridiales bacterium]